MNWAAILRVLCCQRLALRENTDARHAAGIGCQVSRCWGHDRYRLQRHWQMQQAQAGSWRSRCVDSGHFH